MRPIIDISQTLRSGLPVWPGDTAFEAQTLWGHGPDCPVEVAAMLLSTHSGTHADAPIHYDPAGPGIDAVALDAYLGPARVIDLRGVRPVVTAAMIAPHLAPGVTRVLLRTFDRFPHDDWTGDFAVIAADAIALMATHGVVLIGTDAPSLDPQESKTLDAHHAVRRAGMAILEGLVLDDVAGGDYDLVALPLKLGGLDASPVRAVLRPL